MIKSKRIGQNYTQNEPLIRLIPSQKILGQRVSTTRRPRLAVYQTINQPQPPADPKITGSVTAPFAPPETGNPLP